MNLSRRGLLGLLGILAAGVGASIVRPNVLMPIKPKLAASIRDFTAEELSFLEGMSQTITQTMFYGTDETPIEYTSFVPFVPARA